jgi:transcriptional regulator with XRE-family HTH domain
MTDLKTLTLGRRIQTLRREQVMTQEILAERMGVTPQAVSKWENDISCPDISLLPQLVRILGVTADELLTGKTSDVVLVPEKERKSLDELTLRISVNSAEGDKVRVNLPMTLVKIGLELGIDLAPKYADRDLIAMSNLDLTKIVELAERGALGKLVEVESADGDIVEVVVE